MRVLAIVAVVYVFAGCGSSNRVTATAPPPQPAPSIASSHIRELLAGVAAERACDQLRDTFHSLRKPDNSDVITGTLWIRKCSIRHDGTKLTFHFEGDGWRWVDQSTSKAGATFTVHQYAKFHVVATLVGTLDVAYAPDSKVATVWYRPTEPVQASVQSRGDVDVDSQGTWSSIVGAVAGAVSSSPEERARHEIATKGAQGFASQLDSGLTITADTCSGLVRTHLGMLPAGQLAAPSVGETLDEKLELHEGAALIIGPEQYARPATLAIDASQGHVHVDVACVDDANKIAAAVLQGESVPAIQARASEDVTGKEDIEIPASSCRAAVIARTSRGMATVAWKRTPQPGEAIVPCDHDDDHQPVANR